MFLGRLGRVAAVLMFVPLLGIVSCGNSEKAVQQRASETRAVHGGETRPTLPASMFEGLTAEAYQAAADIPEVIDGLYCYCECEKHFGHRSLLTCFVDEHAVHCDICIYEALVARDLHAKGVDAQGIRKAVDERFAHLSADKEAH